MLLYEIFNGVDPNKFEEFLEPEEYVDHGHLFATDRIFNSKPELVNWAKETAIKVNTYLIVTRYLRSRTSDRRPYIILGCKRGGANKPKKKPVVDDEEEEVQVKRRGPYGTKKCGCPFKLKGGQMAISQKIYNVAAKIKKNRMQGRNTVEEVLCLIAIRDYTVFYRNREDSNMLSDIVIAHPTSIEMLRTWPYILIMDTTYKTNKYNMPLLEVVGMTPTGKNFTVASAFMRNEQATTYRWVLQQIKHL
ncbi:hypothetical protein M9H77_09096 [Catharanthus roseus]|uniref:Uncharacterized protein n=1 Tax=Catharanthus roseus TaxID=4058 RepID=A0ACC0C020_CATRO|nr:hypothetical protein M9H77_09096 [Catharanthus roseus]